ncbi:hypothetical protein [Baaleninema sp.]
MVSVSPALGNYTAIASNSYGDFFSIFTVMRYPYPGDRIHKNSVI